MEEVKDVEIEDGGDESHDEDQGWDDGEQRRPGRGSSVLWCCWLVRHRDVDTMGR